MGIIGVIVAIILIAIIIFIHEFGHYIMGKLSGCSVSKFSIGWGPKLTSFKKKETEYRISWFPFIGGYVRMPGMEGESMALTEEESEDIKRYNLKTFEELRSWQKFLVFIGGIGLQIITCILILTLFIDIFGKPVKRVVVTDVITNSPAEAAGLRKMDIIIKVDGQVIDSPQELIDITKDKSDRLMNLTVRRESQFLKIAVKPTYSDEHKRAMMGIQIGLLTEYKKEGMRWFDYLFGGIIFTGKISLMILQQIWMLITNQVSIRYVMGPVGIVLITKDIVQAGFLQTLLFFALININLAIINLLPFPALDGGHIFILSMEKIFRTRIKSKVKEIINMIGLALLIIFIIYVTFNDITREVQNKESQVNKAKEIEVK